MGQYFVAVNQTRKEYVCLWCLGGTAKLWSICTRRFAAVFPYLLRKSSRTGGGDIADPETSRYAGRWAGDEVELVGNYDESGGFEKAFSDYVNISPQLAAEFNQFIGVKKHLLKVRLCNYCHRAKADAAAKVDAGS